MLNETWMCFFNLLDQLFCNYRKDSGLKQKSSHVWNLTPSLGESDLFIPAVWGHFTSNDTLVSPKMPSRIARQSMFPKRVIKPKQCNMNRKFFKITMHFHNLIPRILGNLLIPTGHHTIIKSENVQESSIFAGPWILRKRSSKHRLLRTHHISHYCATGRLADNGSMTLDKGVLNFLGATKSPENTKNGIWSRGKKIVSYHKMFYLYINYIHLYCTAKIYRISMYIFVVSSSFQLNACNMMKSRNSDHPRSKTLIFACCHPVGKIPWTLAFRLSWS